MRWSKDNSISIKETDVFKVLLSVVQRCLNFCLYAVGVLGRRGLAGAPAVLEKVRLHHSARTVFT